MNLIISQKCDPICFLKSMVFFLCSFVGFFWFNAKTHHILGGGFKYCYFHPYLGKWSNLTNIFQMGWNHQLVFPWVPKKEGRWTWKWGRAVINKKPPSVGWIRHRGWVGAVVPTQLNSGIIISAIFSKDPFINQRVFHGSWFILSAFLFHETLAHLGCDCTGSVLASKNSRVVEPFRFLLKDARNHRQSLRSPLKVRVFGSPWNTTQQMAQKWPGGFLYKKSGFPSFSRWILEIFRQTLGVQRPLIQ